MKNRINKLTAICLFVLCISCNKQTSDSTIPIIPVDVEANDQCPLSEVADEIKAIELEMTDESIIGWVKRVLYLKDYIIVSEGKQEKILLFDKTGKFIRVIGNKGQGPEEYLYLTDIAFNDQEQCLYVSGRDRILCYDLNGNYIKKTSLKNTSFFEYICYTNGSLSVIGTTIGEKAENGFINRTVLYHIDNDLQIIDSLEIKKVLLSMVVEVLNSRSDY
ncbi:MAG: 6-bladed beta-propeller, partial [Tannerella sp.]|nr:6-bladed beta-propeller [Tannerella sp.]